MLIATVRRRRAGFTLVEILVVLVLMGIFAAAMVNLLLRQQRFYNSTSQVILTRQQIRQATFMLPADLRGMSRAGGDLAVMTDSSIEFRSVFGTSVACMVNTAGAWISTVPVRLVKGSAMTSWKVSPAVNDSVALYDDGASIGAQDDGWRFSRITAVSLVTGDNVNGCPVASRLDSIVDLTASNPSYHHDFSGADGDDAAGSVDSALPARALQPVAVGDGRQLVSRVLRLRAESCARLQYAPADRRPAAPVCGARHDERPGVHLLRFDRGRDRREGPGCADQCGGAGAGRDHDQPYGGGPDPAA